VVPADYALNVDGGRVSAERHRTALFCAMVMPPAVTSDGRLGCAPQLLRNPLTRVVGVLYDRPDFGLQRGRCRELAGTLVCALRPRVVTPPGSR
jgi:hypothetical protein